MTDNRFLRCSFGCAFIIWDVYVYFKNTIYVLLYSIDVTDRRTDRRTGKIVWTFPTSWSQEKTVTFFLRLDFFASHASVQISKARYFLRAIPESNLYHLYWGKVEYIYICYVWWSICTLIYSIVSNQVMHQTRISYIQTCARDPYCWQFQASCRPPTLSRAWLPSSDGIGRC